MAFFEIVLCFFIISSVYASVGFGGGSSYLAILALNNLPFKEIRFVALLCNIVVVTSAVVIFIHRNEVSWRKIIPLVILSIPMAYLGASIKLSEHIFFLTLGVTLMISSAFLWVKTRSVLSSEESNRNYFLPNALLGGFIGFLSGMVGIGGGIFLSPLLNLLKWDTAKKIAIASSIFILVNSISGISGQLLHISQDIPWLRISALIITVFIGGQVGSRLLVTTFSHLMIRRITSLLVFIAGVEVIIKHI